MKMIRTNEVDLQVDFDLKRILLGEKYDKDRPIHNVLLAKLDSERVDETDDYVSGTLKGHIENYKVVSHVFASFPAYGEEKRYDVMHSFWTTFKSYLQIVYWQEFLPEKYANGTLGKPEIRRKASRNDAPFDSHNSITMTPSYIAYYHTYFPQIKKKKGDTWLGFITKNTDYFKKVMENEKLNRFAILTHTIGNLTIVPKNFNRWRGAFDYWDFGIIRLPNFSPEHDLDYHIRTYLYQDALNEDGKLKPLWPGHYDITVPYLPETPEQVEAFLDNVTDQIIKRGERLVVRLKQEETA